MCFHPDSDGFFWPTFSPDLHWPKPAGDTQLLFSLFPPAITDVDQTIFLVFEYLTRGLFIVKKVTELYQFRIQYTIQGAQMDFERSEFA